MTSTPETAPGVKRYRKKPVEVQTLEWTGRNLDAIRAFAGEERLRYLAGVEDETLHIWNDQENGWIPCPAGHSVVEGRLGEFYPISPAAIAATYEPAEDSADPVAAERERIARLAEELDACYTPRAEADSGIAFSFADFIRGRQS
jgi:hypothetical protein